MIRIGMIVPSSNTVVEDATIRLLASRGDVLVVSTRVRVQTISSDSGGAAFGIDSMVDAALLLADARPDVIVWNGTAGSWLGVDHDDAVCTAIAAATGVPATTSTLAILRACRHLGVDELAVASPYTGDIVDRIIAEYAKHGVAVTGHAEWGLSDNFSFAAASSMDVAELMVEAAANVDVDALALICTNVDGTAVTPRVEAAIGRPVIDSIAATLWCALDIAGADTHIGGWGHLLDRGSTIRRRGINA
ncbi:Asp/Glu racemase [Gordonia sp. CPCC 206044]|uniref:maleate cis-trans isomerase family protein n=1 Tax=Gordonia sp. CPCC 206044 TaxID=3140793 RepID=UPI003AF3FAFB